MQTSALEETSLASAELSPNAVSSLPPSAMPERAPADTSTGANHAGSSPTSEKVAPPKPKLRGVSHQIAFFVAVAATAWLVLGARTPSSARAALVFGTSLASLLGISALYHRVNWQHDARMRMRRLDHAAIFGLIGGGYTPLFALVPSSSGGHGALTSIWVGAAIGIVKSLAWPKAPKWVSALVCVTLGWTVVGQVLDRTPAVGRLCIGMLVASGVSYSLGAVVYAMKRPDPWPRTFGYHEIFHLVVVLASIFLFVHVCLVLRAV